MVANELVAVRISEASWQYPEALVSPTQPYQSPEPNTQRETYSTAIVVGLDVKAGNSFGLHSPNDSATRSSARSTTDYLEILEIGRNFEREIEIYKHIPRFSEYYKISYGDFL